MLATQFWKFGKNNDDETDEEVTTPTLPVTCGRANSLRISHAGNRRPYHKS